MNNSNPWAKVFKEMAGFGGATQFLRSPTAPSPSINSPTAGFRPAASPGLRELPLAGMPQLPFTGIPQLPQLPGPDPVGSEGGPKVQLGGFGLGLGGLGRQPSAGSTPSYSSGMLGHLIRLFGGGGSPQGF
jgi:hypothetical protein